MKITYRADAPIAHISIEGVSFAAGESKDVRDELAVGLLKNANFVDDRGRNENFECRDCGRETREIAFTDHVRNVVVNLRHEDGRLRCVDCHVPAPIAASPVAQTPSVPSQADPEPEPYEHSDL